MKREIRNAERRTRLTTSSLPEWGLPCTSSPRCAHICARSLHSIAPALRSGRRPSRRENSDLTLIQLRVKSGLHGGEIERFFLLVVHLFDLVECQEKTVETFYCRSGWLGLQNFLPDHFGEAALRRQHGEQVPVAAGDKDGPGKVFTNGEPFQLI